MDKARIRHAISYMREEILKISLFLVLLYGFVFGILRQPSEVIYPAPVASPSEEIAVVSAQSEGNSVSIPSLGISAPLLIVDSKNTKDFRKPLKKGTALFPSSLPGQKGTAIILGHSAPLGWPKTNYDWVFSNLRDMNPGEKIRITFNTIEHSYTVAETVILQRGQEIPAQYLSEKTSSVILISCWPPGIDNKRIGVYAIIDTSTRVDKP